MISPNKNYLPTIRFLSLENYEMVLEIGSDPDLIEFYSELVETATRLRKFF